MLLSLPVQRFFRCFLVLSKPIGGRTHLSLRACGAFRSEPVRLAGFRQHAPLFSGLRKRENSDDDDNDDNDDDD